jgi:hypothetical protein
MVGFDFTVVEQNSPYIYIAASGTELGRLQKAAVRRDKQSAISEHILDRAGRHQLPHQ